MYLHVSELLAFYARPLGRIVRCMLGHRVRARWRNVAGLTIIGLGFASPYLGAFRGEVKCLGAMMPASQGALIWPREGSTCSVLVEETHLPLTDNSVDRLLAVHCLEGSEATRQLLREIWRVLSPEGRLILIVPNRRSIWARLDVTPFGYGRPYSLGQLQLLLSETMFASVDCTWALHFPPFERQIVLNSAIALERFGAQVWPGFGGVIFVEARKELAAPTVIQLRTPPVRSLGGLVTVRSV